MRKVFLSLALIMDLTAIQVNAQNISGGIKVEGNMSNFILKDMNAESKAGVGATIGGFGKIEFSENFALQPEVLLHLKNSELKDKTTKQKMDFQYFGVEIPVYAVGYTAIGNGKGFVGVGPYVGFGIDAKYKKSGASDINLYKDNAMQRWDFGGSAILGYELSNNLLVSATYKLGFINALDKGSDDSKMHNQAFSLGLGYSF